MRNYVVFQNGLYLNPIFNGNWPTVVIQRTKFRDQLANSSKIRLPKFTDAEINRIKGTYDYLGINYYYANLIANVPESNSTVLDYDSDVRVDVGVDPNWIVNYLFPVSKFLNSSKYYNKSSKLFFNNKDRIPNIN